MPNTELRVWWLTEPECRAIGSPYDSSDPEEEEEFIAEGKTDPQWVDLAELPWPDYVKKQFACLWGEGPNGDLFIAEDLSAEAANLYAVEFENARLAKRCEQASGIVIRAEDAMLVLPYGGFMTDEYGYYSA